MQTIASKNRQKGREIRMELKKLEGKKLEDEKYKFISCLPVHVV